MDAASFYLLGALLIVVGIIIIIAAIILASGRSAGKVKGAGIIMIGPVPIVFGADKKSIKTLLALALALTIAVIIAMLVFNWLLR